MPATGFKFVQRDSDLLLDLYKHRFLTISQIEGLHFPSLQTAYRRTRLLKQAGFIDSFTVPNIEESIFNLTAKGLEAVAGAIGVGKTELKASESKTKPHDYYFMRHFVAINDFRIALRQACENSEIRKLGFIPDYYGEKTDKGGITKYIRDVACDIAGERDRISHTPDGVFALQKDGKAALFFLEIDRGTEVISDTEKGVLKAIRFYLNYLLEGTYRRYAKDFNVDSFKGFRTLLVTTSEARAENIRRASVKLEVPDKARKFIWITTEDEISKESLFHPIWKSIDPQDNSGYRIG